MYHYYKRRIRGNQINLHIIVTIQPPLPHIRISNTSCSFLAFSKAKNAHMWRGALFGSKCMEIKVSYVQARRFIDFHTLILNSYTLFIIALGMYLWYNEIRQIIVDFYMGNGGKE